MEKKVSEIIKSLREGLEGMVNGAQFIKSQFTSTIQVVTTAEDLIKILEELPDGEKLEEIIKNLKDKDEEIAELKSANAELTDEITNMRAALADILQEIADMKDPNGIKVLLEKLAGKVGDPQCQLTDKNQISVILS